jgi:hypothetical protein
VAPRIADFMLSNNSSRPQHAARRAAIRAVN